MAHNPLIIRARYILVLLRLAYPGEAHYTVRLLRYAASEYPHPDMPAYLVSYEDTAINAVQALYSAHSFIAKVKPYLWERAEVAAWNWLDAA